MFPPPASQSIGRLQLDTVIVFFSFLSSDVVRSPIDGKRKRKENGRSSGASSGETSRVIYRTRKSEWEKKKKKK
jgi:hypothetical protein